MVKRKISSPFLILSFINSFYESASNLKIQRNLIEQVIMRMKTYFVFTLTIEMTHFFFPGVVSDKKTITLNILKFFSEDNM